jgi:hypothetical protein
LKVLGRNGENHADGAGRRDGLLRGRCEGRRRRDGECDKKAPSARPPPPGDRPRATLLDHRENCTASKNV